jgi:hypothetical protein
MPLAIADLAGTTPHPVAHPRAGGWRGFRPLATLLLWASFALAWPAWAGALPGELPAMVGRLSTLQGEVQWYDRDSQAWLGTPQQPLRNWPLATGDRLRTGADARADLRLGSATLRLGADVDLTLERLDERGLVLHMTSGTLALRLAEGVGAEAWPVDMISPDGRWLPQGPGHYRFERHPQDRTPATQATVWRGELRFEGPDSVMTVPAGRRADLWRDARDGATRYAWAAVDRDAFGDWVAREERLDDAHVTAQQVPPGVSGWQDLDRHGEWVPHPEYGSVWQPRDLPPGWAPFQAGRWAWVAPWGWTWIDDAPWGFAPFHYGLWLAWQGRWSWSPGPRGPGHRPPAYAPALHAWIGGPPVGADIRIGGHRPPPPRVVAPVIVMPRPLPPPDFRREPDRGRDVPGIDRDRRVGRDGRDERGSRDGRDPRDNRDGHEGGAPAMRPPEAGSERPRVPRPPLPPTSEVHPQAPAQDSPQPALPRPRMLPQPAPPVPAQPAPQPQAPVASPFHRAPPQPPPLPIATPPAQPKAPPAPQPVPPSAVRPAEGPRMTLPTPVRRAEPGDGRDGREMRRDERFDPRREAPTGNGDQRSDRGSAAR